MNKKQYQKAISYWSNYYNKLIWKYINNSSCGDVLLALLHEKKNEQMIRITKHYYEK